MGEGQQTCWSNVGGLQGSIPESHREPRSSCHRYISSTRHFYLIECILCHSGQWKKEEEEELTRIVTEMTVDQGKDFDNDVFWGKVSEKMGNRRGRQQCRIKW
jgi:hypothetical protein